MERYQRHFQAYWKLRRWFIDYVEGRKRKRDSEVVWAVLDKLRHIQKTIEKEIYLDTRGGVPHGTCKRKDSYPAGKDIRICFLGNGLLCAEVVDVG